VFLANNRAVIKERMATGEYKNLSLFGTDIYNFYTNQIVETIDLPDGESCYMFRKSSMQIRYVMYGVNIYY